MQQQVLKLGLAPRINIGLRLQQALALLHMPRLRLEEVLNVELQQNPVLADEREDFLELDDEAIPLRPETENADLQGWPLALQPDPVSNSHLAEGRGEHDERAFRTVPTLSEHLFSQLRLATTEQSHLAIGQYLIGCLDDAGYLTGSVEEVSAELSVSDRDVRQVLALIQTFDPLGVGARDVRECLLLQLQHETQQNPSNTLALLATELVHDHFATLLRHGKKGCAALAQAKRVPVEQVQAAIDCVKKLDLHPGYRFSNERPPSIIPDLIVHNIGKNEYAVTLNDHGMPRLRINQTYGRLLRDAAGTDDNTQAYLADRMARAQWLMKVIARRRRTLESVVVLLLQGARNRPGRFDLSNRRQGCNPTGCQKRKSLQSAR